MKRAMVFLAVLAACGGGSSDESDGGPNDSPDSGGPIVDGGMTPDAKVLMSPIALRTTAPVSILAEGDQSGAFELADPTATTLLVTGSAEAEGLVLTVNGTVVAVDTASRQWSHTVSLNPIDCAAPGLTQQDAILVVAKNHLGETLTIRIDVIRDPCPPKASVIATTVEDESTWSLTFTNDVPCLRSVTPTLVTIDGTGTPTVKKYQSNFYGGALTGNLTYTDVAGTRGCVLAGISDPAGGNPVLFKWKLSDNLQRTLKATIEVKLPEGAFTQIGGERDVLLADNGEGQLEVALTTSEVASIHTRGSGPVTVRGKVVDSLGNEVVLPETTIDLVVLPGPIELTSKDFAGGEEGALPTNALGGATSYAAAAGSPALPLPLRRETFVNRTDEPVVLSFDGSSFGYLPQRTWRRTATDDVSFKTSCTAGPIGWTPGDEGDAGGGSLVDLPLSFKQTGGVCLNGAACTQVRVDGKGTLVLTVSHGGLGTFSGSDRTISGQPVFATSHGTAVTACVPGHQLQTPVVTCGSNSDCRAGYSCQIVDPEDPQDDRFVCLRRGWDATTSTRLKALHTFSFITGGQVQIRYGAVERAGWWAPFGPSSLANAANRNFVEDAAIPNP
jgi:hypothetical protein